MVAGLNAGPSANFTTRGMLAGLVEGRSTTNFALSLMAKDLSEALALGLASGAAMPVEPLPLSSPDATATVKKKGPARRPLTPSPDTTATNNEPP
jgi:3-hydroxyisobutyrate dehydrogenase